MGNEVCSNCSMLNSSLAPQSKRSTTNDPNTKQSHWYFKQNPQWGEIRIPLDSPLSKTKMAGGLNKEADVAPLHRTLSGRLLQHIKNLSDNEHQVGPCHKSNVYEDSWKLFYTSLLFMVPAIMAFFFNLLFFVWNLFHCFNGSYELLEKCQVWMASLD